MFHRIKFAFEEVTLTEMKYLRSFLSKTNYDSKIQKIILH